MEHSFVPKRMSGVWDTIFMTVKSVAEPLCPMNVAGAIPRPMFHHT